MNVLEAAQNNTSEVLNGLFSHLEKNGWKSTDSKENDGFLPIPPKPMEELRGRILSAFNRVISTLDSENAEQEMYKRMWEANQLDGLVHEPLDFATSWLLLQVIYELNRSGVETGWVYQSPEKNPLSVKGATEAILALDKDHQRLGFISFLDPSYF